VVICAVVDFSGGRPGTVISGSDFPKGSVVVIPQGGEVIFPKVPWWRSTCSGDLQWIF
jgi:hypothetical protein